jgi:hypothetical protein
MNSLNTGLLSIGLLTIIAVSALTRQTMPQQANSLLLAERACFLVSATVETTPVLDRDDSRVIQLGLKLRF